MPGKTPRKNEPPAGWGSEDIREILDLLEERGITEFELERNGFRVRIKREMGPGTVLAQHGAAFSHPEPLPVMVGPAGMTSKAAHTPAPEPVVPEPPAKESSEDLYIIKSPIVGTYYAAPGPDVPPFVKIGDTVRPGQVLCIIEAMKLMNEIEAEVAGEITRVFVDNGQPVEYGQSLFGILPSSSQP